MTKSDPDKQRSALVCSKEKIVVRSVVVVQTLNRSGLLAKRYYCYFSLKPGDNSWRKHLIGEEKTENRMHIEL